MGIVGKAGIIRRAWRRVRNIYFWLVLGSILVTLFWASSIHRSVHDGDTVAEEHDDASDEPTQFVEGLMTAFGLVMFWSLLYLQYQMRHPKWSKLRAPVMDYESGQLAMPRFCVAEGSKWPWVACVRETKSGNMFMVELEARISRRDDLDYDEDIHIVPIKATEEGGRFGVHGFTRSCCCHPELMEQVRGRTLVIHSEKTN